MLKKCWGNTHLCCHGDNDTETMNKQKEIDDQIGGCMEEKPMANFNAAHCQHASNTHWKTTQNPPPKRPPPRGRPLGPINDPHQTPSPPNVAHRRHPLGTTRPTPKMIPQKWQTTKQLGTTPDQQTK